MVKYLPPAERRVCFKDDTLFLAECEKLLLIEERVELYLIRADSDVLREHILQVVDGEVAHTECTDLPFLKKSFEGREVEMLCLRRPVDKIQVKIVCP